jgi:hypothetical protein
MFLFAKVILSLLLQYWNLARGQEQQVALQVVTLSHYQVTP